MLAKSKDLSGWQLNAAVALALGYTNLRRNTHRFDTTWLVDHPNSEYGTKFLKELNFESRWELAGPIIQQEEIDIYCEQSKEAGGGEARFIAEIQIMPRRRAVGRGKTVLMAAMRAFVVSKLGDQFEVPDELIGG